MALKIRNRFKHIYRLKAKIKRIIYSNQQALKSYLKLKETFIKAGRINYFKETTLFSKVFIETISFCNNNCVFCPAASSLGLKRPEHFMPEETYLKILGELTSISFMGSLAFHCNNEPLLDKRLASWIKAARTRLKRNFLYLYTNGIFINAGLANKLFDAGLNRIIISNYTDTHELIPSVKQLADNSAVLRGEIVINYRLKTDFLGNRAGEAPNAKTCLETPLKIICLRPLDEIIIGYDGSVPLCCADGAWKVIMGNALKSNLKDIWFSDSFKEIRRSLARGDRSCTEICKTCDALNLPALKGIHL